MTQQTPTINETDKLQASWRAYLELCKPKVVILMILTALVGMCLATPGLVPWSALVFGLTGIALCAGSAAVINHLIDRRFDAIMARTEARPIPTGQVKPRNALIFSLAIGALGMLILFLFVNSLTAILTFFTLISYAIVYTVFLKHSTPQNIVIGGIAGAMPPLLGWTAVTGQFDPYSLLLVLIIYTWTPPHFWALAIYRFKEYQKADIPMLPITHGIAFTKLNIVLYTVLLLISSILPYITGMCGLIYLAGAVVLGLMFLYYAIKLWRNDDAKIALRTFIFSIYYLMFLFVFLLLDHYLQFQLL